VSGEPRNPFWSKDYTLLRHPHVTSRLHPHPVPLQCVTEPPCVCLTVNVVWASHLRGLLETLLWEDSWSGSDVEKQWAIDQVIKLEDLMGREGCYERGEDVSGPELVRLSLQDMYDGTPESLHPDAPDLTFGLATTDDTPSERLARRLALCRAVNRYVRTLFEQAASALRSYGEIVSTGPGGLLGLLYPVAGAILAFGATLTTDLLALALEDEDSVKDVICCMYSHLLDLPTLPENFASAPGDCGFTFPSNQAQLAGILHTCCNNWGNYHAFIRVLGEEWSVSLSEESGPDLCLCPGSCIQEWDFEANGRLGWYINPDWDYGIWDTGVGWTAEVNADDHYSIYVSKLCETDVQIASVDVEVTFDAPSGEGNTLWLAFYDAEGNKDYESAKACASGRATYHFVTNGILAHRIEVSERLVPTSHHYPIHIHRVLSVAF